MAKHWTTGKYGEIIPYSLVAGLNPDEILQDMVGIEIFRQMPENEREMFYGEAAIYAHQKRLERVFSGLVGGDEALAAIFEGVMNGTPITLCPLGYENWPHAFAPVLQYLGRNTWRVGVAEGAMPIRILTGPAETVYRQARQLYVSWVEAGETVAS